jgi:hypothetical protein
MGRDIAIDAARDKKMFTHKDTTLTQSQLAALHLYSQETDLDLGQDSVYELLNSVLRSSNRALVRCIRQFPLVVVDSFAPLSQKQAEDSVL